MKTFQVEDEMFKTKPLFVVNCTHTELDVYLKKHFKIGAGLDCQQAGQMFTFDKSPWRVVLGESDTSQHPHTGNLAP